MNVTNKMKKIVRENNNKVITLGKEEFFDLLEESRTGVIDKIRAGKEGVYEFSLMLNIIPEVKEVIFIR